MKIIMFSNAGHDSVIIFFFFNDTATTEIYTLSLHDALPIYGAGNGTRTRDIELGRLAL